MIYKRYLCHRLCKPALVITKENSICSHNYTIYDKKSEEATYYVWNESEGDLSSNTFSCFCCLPTPTTLASGGIRCSRFWSTSQLIYPLAISSIIPAGSVHKSRGDSVVRMWVQLKRLCVSCVWVLQRDIVVLDVIWCRLCVNMIWGRVIYMFWFGEGCDEWGGKFV